MLSDSMTSTYPLGKDLPSPWQIAGPLVRTRTLEEALTTPPNVMAAPVRTLPRGPQSDPYLLPQLFGTISTILYTIHTMIR